MTFELSLDLGPVPHQDDIDPAFGGVQCPGNGFKGSVVAPHRV